MPKPTNIFQKLARKAFKRLDADIRDRAGIKHVWHDINRDVMKEELRPDWERIIAEEFQKALIPLMAMLPLIGIPCTSPVSFGDCPIGLFLFDGTLCVKTEYSTNGRSDAYVIESGEYFWGGESTPAGVNALFVTPLNTHGA